MEAWESNHCVPEAAKSIDKNPVSFSHAAFPCDMLDEMLFPYD
jgi:hypothetical protein